MNNCDATTWPDVACVALVVLLILALIVGLIWSSHHE